MHTRIAHLLLLLLSTAVAAFSPADHYLIDCGTTAASAVVDLDHRRFTGDGSSPTLSATTKSLALKNSNPDPNFSPVYHTARVFTTPSDYKFKVKEKGPHLLLVRIHFYKFDLNIGSSTCHDQFHVSANGYVLLHNFSAPKGNPIIKDFLISVDSDELVIRFIPVDKTSFAFVNAIEVISAPKDLISNNEYVRRRSDQNNAYETVYRVSVGGVKVTPFNDSLWRNWVPDDEFLKSDDASIKKLHFDGRINYRSGGGASREVGPDNMYNSARFISSLNDSVPKLNMTWVFPVNKAGFSYLVRLHFCDIASISTGMIYFNVYLNGDLVYENLDLSSLTNYMLASPFYADFVVDPDKFSDAIRIDIGPSKLSMPHAVDGMLNGLEIWRMSNSMSSLDGEVCVDGLESKNQSSGGQMNRLLSLTAAVCLLAIAFLVMRRKTGARDSVGWSRVPVDVSEIDLKSSHYTKSAVVNV